MVKRKSPESRNISYIDRCNALGMTHKEKRSEMDKAIKEIVVPFLRSENFKGSYPHFHRLHNDQLNLLTFQFSLYSPKFVVEITNCSPEGYVSFAGKRYKPSECRVNLFGNRLRIGSIKHNTDYWYDFDKISVFGNIYKKKAIEIIANWNEAELWWQNNPVLTN